MRTALVIVWVCVALGAITAQAASVAVLPLAGRRAEGERTALTTSLREELRGLDVAVLDGPTTDRVIASASALGGACPVTTLMCALQLGGLAGVATVVVGELDGDTLTLRALDVAGQREVGRVNVPFDPARPRQTALLAGIRLLRPDREVGYLALFVDVDGATVRIDGQDVGRTPVDLLSLRPGVHEVMVGHPRYETRVHTVEIALAGTATLHVTLSPLPTTEPSSQTDDVTDQGFRHVVVLDVRPPVLARDDDTRLLAALLTLILVDELQRRDRLIVVPPADLMGALGPRRVDLAGCSDDACLQRVLGDGFDGDVVITSLLDEGEAFRLAARRLDLASGKTTALDSRQASKATRPGQRLARRVPLLVDALFAGFEPRPGTTPDATLRARLEPPAVPVVGLVAPVAATVLGVATTIGGVAGWADASARQDEAAVWWAMAAVGGGGLMAAGLATTLIAASDVDWAGHRAHNAALLAEVDARDHSSR